MKKLIGSICAMALLLTLAACDSFYARGAKRVPEDAQLVLGSLDRITYYDRKELEDASEIICLVKPVKNKGQVVGTIYDQELKKDLCTSGYTNFDIEVVEVFKGEVSKGDVLEFAQQYFVWEDEGVTQLISDTGTYPLEKGETYLMFLKYSSKKHYYPLGDWSGLYIYPTENIIEKIKSNSLTIDDVPVRSKMIPYQDEYVDLYKDVMNQYFINK